MHLKAGYISNGIDHCDQRMPARKVAVKVAFTNGVFEQLFDQTLYLSGLSFKWKFSSDFITDFCPVVEHCTNIIRYRIYIIQVYHLLKFITAGFYRDEKGI